MNPQEFPLYRALTVRLEGSKPLSVLEQLLDDERLFYRLCKANIEAWPTLKIAVEQVSAMRAAEMAGTAIDGISHG
jgi:hypothetical protein